ncbi:MAG: T9SS type A sorting domain-containing protein, partial [Bacteroidota bacterium]|nr:T9SS type A sorting domain-containing protein [Bacteroidota bacterium]
SKNPPEGQTHSWMDTQLFLVELKANPRIWRLAHTHAYTSLDFDGEKNYFAEAFAAINTAGTRVYFGSNWCDFTPDYSETYVVELPARWKELMPGGTVSCGEPAPADLSAHVYPNPCHGAATLSLASGVVPRRDGPAEWAVFDMLGRTVLRGSCAVGDRSVSARLDVSRLPAGMYGVLVRGGGAFVRVPLVVGR